MRCVFLLLCACSCANSACDRLLGPSGQTDCIKINSYNDYQWATCLTDRYIRMESSDRHYCLKGNTFCYYQCMIELNNKEEGDVFTNCLCDSEKASLPRSNVSLPSWCYSPNGTECNWFTECFQRKYPCFDKKEIEFYQSFCELYVKHGILFSIASKQWIGEIKDCFLTSKVALLRPWLNYPCNDIITNVSIATQGCLSRSSHSVCSVNNYDFYTLFITLDETARQSGNGSVNFFNDLWRIRIECNEANSVVGLYDITVLHVMFSAKIDHRHTLDSKSVFQFDDIKANNIIDNISDRLEWPSKGISWHAWTYQENLNIVLRDNSIFVLIASRLRYDFNFAHTISQASNTNETLYTFVDAIKSGLSLSVDNLIINITSLEACEDLRCQHVYLDTNPSDNNNGYCPSDYSEGVHWNKTANGTTDVKPCPSGYHGNTTRICTSASVWENASFINCVNTNLQETSEKLDNLENITDPDEAALVITDILHSVGNITTSGSQHGKPIKSGDLQKSAEILSSVVRIGKTKNASVNTEVALDVVDSMLNSENSNSWQEVNSQGDSDGTSTMMRVVDELGSLIKHRLLRNQTINVKRKNLELEISAMKGTLQFPKNSKSLILDDQPVLNGKFYTAVLYKTISASLPTPQNSSIGSDVLAVSFDQPINYLDRNVTIEFKRNKDVRFHNPGITCGYWNFTLRSWSYSGCYLQKSDGAMATCTCNHLTNFAILMRPGDVDISKIHQTALEMITFIGCGLSILGCLLTLIIYFLLWRYVKNEWAVILVHLCIALIIGYSVFIGAVEETSNDVACNAVTAILHYIFLVVFFLMLAEGITVATSVTIVFKQKSRLPIYLALAWVIPLFIVGITMGITQAKTYHSDKYCWLNIDRFVYLSFVGPAMVIILLNIGTICLVLRALYSSGNMINERMKKKARAGVKCLVTLLPVLGLSWLFGVLAFNEQTLVFQYLFGITTSCQGVFIFIFHTVLNKKAHEGLRKTLYKRRTKAKALSDISSKNPKSSRSPDKLDSRVDSTDSSKEKPFKTDTTTMNDFKTNSPQIRKKANNPDFDDISESPSQRSEKESNFQNIKTFLKITKTRHYQISKD